MENPFVFGKVVFGNHFCDREKEIEEIKKLVRSKQHIVIISPRRYGKTSLVINALERNSIPFIYVDCSFVEDEKNLANLLLNDYVKKFDNIAMLEKFLKRFDFSFSITLNPVSIIVSQVKTNTLKSLLTEASKNYVLVFDEFQDINEKNPDLVNKIRSIVQFLDKSVIMLGSKRHLLDSMFLKPRGIFYNFGYSMHLGKIAPIEFKKFIFFWFKKNGLEISEKDVDEALEASECHPFFTQYLCHFLFEKTIVEKTSVQETIDSILDTNSVFYEETYRSLPASQQKALLLISYGKKQIYSAELLAKFGISSSQTLQKALKALTKKELIDKNGDYRILDVFFKHWLYQKVLNQKV